jgi:hypothetical protein
MAIAALLANIYVWMVATFLLLAFMLVLIIFLIVLAKKTHMVVELKAWLKGWPIAMFYEENRYCEWKPVKPDAGIINDKHYGAYIINERATYVDKRTKNVLIPFDASFGASVNVHAAKLIDDLQYMYKDEEKMKMLRHGIINNLIDDSETINVLKTSINFGAVKNMMTALIPHNINAKIEKTIASRMKGMGNVNVPQVALLFAAIFGAIILGGITIKMMTGGGN